MMNFPGEEKCLLYSQIKEENSGDPSPHTGANLTFLFTSYHYSNIFSEIFDMYEMNRIL